MTIVQKLRSFASTGDVADGESLMIAALRIEHLEQALIGAASQCDQWATESRNGGWSTHQVKANADLADDLRRIAGG